MTKKILVLFILSLIYLFYISVLSSRVTLNTQRGYGSWDLVHEGLVAPYKSFADSHLYLGLGITKGQDFFYNGPNEKPRPYLHYPSGIGLTIYTMYHFLGYEGDRHLFIPQLLPLITSSVSFFLVFLLSYLWTRSLSLSLIGVILFVLTPMSLYYGHIIEHQPISLPFILLSLLFYFYYLKEEKPQWMIATFLASLGASFYCWTGFFILPAFIAHQIILGGTKRVKLKKGFVLWAMIILICTSVAVLGQIYWANNFSFEAFKEGFSRRIIGITYNQKITPFSFLLTQWLFLQRLFTLPLIFMVFLFLLKCLKNIIAKKPMPLQSQTLLLSSFFALGYLLFFPYNSIAHEYAQFYFLPLFIFSPLLLLKDLSNSYPPPKKNFLVVFGIILLILLVYLSGKSTIYDRYTNAGQYLPPTPLLEIFK